MTINTVTIGEDLKVRRIGFGTMRLTSGQGKWGMPPDESHAVKVLQKAVDIGIDLFDTADMYGPGFSESIIAKALYPYPTNVVIATKGGNQIHGPNRVLANCSPDYLRNAVHGSLKRLKLERIDLYQLHTVDANTAIESSIEQLAKMRDEGKIRFIGVCNVLLDDLKRALSVAEIQTVQNRFNKNDTTFLDVVKFAERRGMVFLSYYPLAKGVLAKGGPLKRESAITNRNELTPAQRSLVWQLNLSRTLLPIPGTTSIEHLEENQASWEFYKP